jgi:photosystem II stability/assembly factor-like uncharacterized protein
MKHLQLLLRWLVPLALIATLGGATVAILHRTAPSLAARNLTALHRTLHLMQREGIGGDADAVRPARGQEGPIQSALGLAYYERAFPAKTIPPAAYPNGVNEYNLVAGNPGNRTWQQLGPLYAPNANFPNPKTGASTAVSGRVSALAVVPSTCSGSVCGTIYVGAANGGVWKTTDAGATWTPLLDRQQSTAVGAITLDPQNPNIVYVGTGEPNFSCDSQAGSGLFRSTDGGATWTQFGYSQFVNRSISSIIIDPRTAGSTNATLYVSSFSASNNNSTTESCDYSAAPYLPPRGVYISRDGGQSWTLSRPAGASFGAQSMVMDPANPNVLYAGFTFVGPFKSTDDGASWTALTNGLPSPASVNFDRITLAVAPSNDQVLYASYNVNGSAGGYQVFFRSADGGASWTQQANTPDACDGQCWYDMPLAVDPMDANVVYAGGSANYGYLFGTQPECATFSSLAADCNTAMMKTTDGGATWSDVQENGLAGPIHPDDHVIVIDPNNHGVVYTGNDGGVFHSADGATSWNDLNQGLGTLQFQGLAVGPSGNIYAGTQDNGTFEYTGSTTWTHVNGGDGGPTATDPTNTSISYNSYYGAQLFRNDHAGDPASDTWIAPFWGDYFLAGQGQFYEPYAVAPSSPNVLIYGTYRLWRSLSRGGTDGNNDGDATNDPSDTIDWQPISFDLSCPSQPTSPSTICGPAVGAYDSIASIAVSPINPNVVAVGTSNGQLWLTTNALAPVTTDTTCDPRTNSYDTSLCNYVSGLTWTRIDSGLPGRFPTALHFAPGSATTLYVTFSGFSALTPGHSGHVFVSTNQGQTWSDIDGAQPHLTLPDLPANDLAVNTTNGHLYVAMDFGVFFSANDGRTWTRIDAGLPNAPVYQMQYDGQSGDLFVATHGRGIWKVHAP